MIENALTEGDGEGKDDSEEEHHPPAPGRCLGIEMKESSDSSHRMSHSTRVPGRAYVVSANDDLVPRRSDPMSIQCAPRRSVAVGILPTASRRYNFPWLGTASVGEIAGQVSP